MVLLKDPPLLPHRFQLSVMLPIKKEAFLGINHGEAFALDHIGEISFQSRMAEYLERLIEAILIDRIRLMI